MPYVMVPVPEEHVEEVMNFMLRAMSRANMVEWDDEAIAEMFSHIDEFAKTLLAFISRHGMQEKDLPESEAASLLQISQRETMAVVREINEYCKDANRPALISRRSTLEVLPNGRTQEIPALAIEPEIAERLAAIEKAERATMTNPIKSD